MARGGFVERRVVRREALGGAAGLAAALALAALTALPAPAAVAQLRRRAPDVHIQQLHAGRHAQLERTRRWPAAVALRDPGWLHDRLGQFVDSADDKPRNGVHGVRAARALLRPGARP